MEAQEGEGLMDYNNVLYRVYTGMWRDDEGSRYCAYIVVTEEANGFAVFDSSLRGENEGLVLFCSRREDAIEHAVDRGRKIKERVWTKMGDEEKFVRDDYREFEPA